MSAYWNYSDALAYALAIRRPDEDESFTADPARWQKAILDLKREYGTELSNVLGRISFDERQGRPPYSAEVDHFLHVMAQSRLLSEPNPAYEVLSLNAEQKKAIRRLNDERLRDLVPKLTKLGEKLAAAVAVKP